jgi:nitroreductase
MKKFIIAVAICAAFSSCPRSPAIEHEHETEDPAVTTDRAGVILSHYATRNFIEGAIPEADLNLILQAGVRAPSARNRQPWYFTVVRDLGLAQKIIPQTVEGNVIVVISAEGDGKTNYTEIIDCSLAVQSIYLAAQALGYGSRIYTGPIDNLNGNLKGDLGIPSGRNAVVVVRIGKFDTEADAVTAASARNSADSVITYK